MLGRIKRIWIPGAYHGDHGKDHYFEGWYYKIADKDRRVVLALIPGIARSEISGDSHSFVQILDGMSGTSRYHRYPVEAFSASNFSHDLSVGPSRFRPDRIELNIEGEGDALKGVLEFDALSPWPVTLFRPGYMGWYAFVPFMECYHGVLSFNHRIRGGLSIGKEFVDFTGGRGYTEKDWGTSFPRSWIWMQTNHFEKTGVSFVMSIATIPWRGTYFTGFGGALWDNGAFHPFATWNGSRIKDLAIRPDSASFSVIHARYGIEVKAEGKDGGELLSPVSGHMTGKVRESMKAEISVRFFLVNRHGRHEQYRGTGSVGGLEIMGDPAELIEGLSP